MMLGGGCEGEKARRGRSGAVGPCGGADGSSSTTQLVCGGESNASPPFFTFSPPLTCLLASFSPPLISLSFSVLPPLPPSLPPLLHLVFIPPLPHPPFCLSLSPLLSLLLHFVPPTFPLPLPLLSSPFLLLSPPFPLLSPPFPLLSLLLPSLPPPLPPSFSLIPVLTPAEKHSGSAGLPHITRRRDGDEAGRRRCVRPAGFISCGCGGAGGTGPGAGIGSPNNGDRMKTRILCPCKQWLFLRVVRFVFVF